MRYFVAILLSIVTQASLAESNSMPSGLNHAELVKVFGGLLLVLLVIILLSWIVKRFNVVQLSSSKGFATVATMIIGPKEKISLIKVGDRYLLIGIGAATVNTLHDFGDQLPSGFLAEDKPSFADLLKSAVRKS